MLLTRNKSRQILRGIVNPLLLRTTSGNRQTLNQSLVVLGHPRSGTTWLAELINTIPNTGIIFEPLQSKPVPEAKKAGFGGQNYRLPGEDWPEGEQFMRKILEGKLLNKWTTSHIPISRATHVERWVVKMVLANQLIGWLTSTFDIPKPILILRHPCAVFASRINRGWPAPPRLPVRDRFLKEHPDLSSTLGELKTPEEYFAVRWCVDHYAPFSLPKPYPFHVISYEKLLLEGPTHLEPAFSDWGLEIPEKMYSLFSRPSAKAGQNNFSNPMDNLSSWKHKLKPAQIEQVLNVVENFGLDFYTDHPEPNYDRMFSEQALTFSRGPESMFSR
jgi:sulfotransferase family protein